MSWWSDLSQTPLLQQSYLAGVLIAITCGLLGPWVIVKRIVFLGEGIAHTAVLGVGLALAINQFTELDRWQVWLFALGAALISAAGLTWAQMRMPGRLDAMIGGLMALGLAGGMSLSTWSGAGMDAMNDYLFGSFSIVDTDGLILLASTAILILICILLFHKRLLALCIDDEYLLMQGLSLFVSRLILLSMIAIAVVSLMQAVGLILVLALLALPAATANLFCYRMHTMIILTTLIALVETTLPRILIHGTSLAAGPGIVLFTAFVFIVALCIRKKKKI